MASRPKQQRYEATAKGKATRRRYKLSVKGQLASMRSDIVERGKRRKATLNELAH